MTIEQKRSAIRTLVRKVVWDGVNAHVVLFGIQDEEIEYPDIASLTKQTETSEENDSAELEQFSDVNYEKDECKDFPKTPWGDHSKRVTNAFSKDKTNQNRSFSIWTNRHG